MSRILPSTLAFLAVAILMANMAIAKPTSSSEEDPMSNDEVLDLVRKSCKTDDLFCPSEKYLVKVDQFRFFNTEAVMDSKKFGVFRSGAISKDDMVDFFRDEFCCVSGKCLEECDIYKLNEKSIIANLPLIYEDLFALGIEELKPYEKMYEHYLKHHNKTHRNPAEIEELYDLLHINESKYINKLGKKDKKKN